MSDSTNDSELGAMWEVAFLHSNLTLKSDVLHRTPSIPRDFPQSFYKLKTTLRSTCLVHLNISCCYSHNNSE